MTEEKLVAMPSNPKIMRFELEMPDGTIHRIQTELLKSGAFDYGNHTCVEVLFDDRRHALFDTRYESKCWSIEGYQELMTDYVMRNWEHDGQIVTRIL